MLSTEAIEHFDQQGYLIVRGAIDATVLTQLQKETDGWIRAADSATETDDRFVFQGGSTDAQRRLERINHPVVLSKLYWEVATSPAMLDRVEALIGRDLSFHHSKMNLKLPGGGAEIGWHQDYVFFPHTNYDLLACGIALDAATEANGCMMVVPGSHRAPLLCHRDEDGEFIGRIVDTNIADDWADQAVRVELQPGDMSIHHCRTIHGSAANLSTERRCVLIMQYAATDAVAFEPRPRINDYYDSVIRGGPRTHARMAEAVSIEMRGQLGTHGSIFKVQR